MPAEKDCPSRPPPPSRERAEKDRTGDTAMDIITEILQGALLDAQHHDDSIRSVAQGKLKELKDKNLPNFLLSLAAELFSDASRPECKRLAGSILKNLLDERCSADGDQWMNMDHFVDGQDGRPKFAPVVGLLLGRLEDPSLEIRVADACTLGQAFQLHSPALGNRVFADEDLRGIITVLTKSTNDVPEVSEEICRGLYFLAQGDGELGHSKKKISSELSPFLGAVIDVLFSASEPCKETPFRLPASKSLYEALSEFVRVTNMQEYPSVAIRGLVPRIMRRMSTVLDAKASSPGDKRNRYDLLVLLCGLLHVVIQKLGTSREAAKTVTHSAQYLLLLFCRTLTCECSTARGKAGLGIGALVDVTGPDLVDQMPTLLQYFSVERLFPIHLDVIGNMFRVFGERMLPYCDVIMDVLYNGLSKSELKSPILECFGVIAVAIGKNFEEYLQPVMKKLKQAAHPKYYPNVSDGNKVDYSNQLRKAIFNAYSGILKGIEDPISGLKVAAALIEFTGAVSKDERRGQIVKDAAREVLSEFSSTVVQSWTKRLISEVTKR